MNIGYNRLDSIMGALKKGTADARTQKAAYQMIARLSKQYRRITLMLDEVLKDQYVKKVRRS